MMDDDDDLLGSLETTLGQVVSASTFTRPLANKKASNTETITACSHRGGDTE